MLSFPQMITRWASQLNPLLSSPIPQGVAVTGIAMTANTPVAINHKLGQPPRGWFPTDQTAAANIYRTQPFNSLTLTLESSANVTVDIWVF